MSDGPRPRLHHGRVSLDVPSAWEDRSTVLLVAPPVAGLAAPMRGKAAPALAGNVCVTFPDRGTPPATARQFLEQIEAGLGPRSRLLASAACKVGGRDGWRVERMIDPGTGLVRQTTIALDCGELLVLATASVDGSADPTAAAAVEEVLGSLRVD